MSLTRTKSVADVRNLGHLRLWLNDLEALVQLLDKTVAVRLIVIDDDYQIDAMADLSEYKADGLKHVEIYGQAAGAKLELSRSTATLKMSDPSIEHLGMASEIERLTKSSRRRIYAFRYIVTVLISLAITTVGLIGSIRHNGTNAATPYAIFLVLGFTAAVFALAAIPATRKSSSALMINATRENAPPWLARNKDGLVTNVIVSVVFLVIGVVLGYILPK